MLCLTRGGATSEDEATQLCNSLQRAGVVITFGDIVYLKPREVAEAVLKVLPGTSQDIEQRLTLVDEELAAMEREYRKIEKSATRWPDFFLKVGFCMLTLHTVAFIYLTYWELSWDVMEPIAYFASLFYSILAYLYFFATRGSILDMVAFKEFWTAKSKTRHVERRNFNAERFQSLLRQRDLYREQLKLVQ